MPDRWIEGPWYVTIAAMEQYLQMRGVNPARATRDQQDRAIGDLLAMARRALASDRIPTRTKSGMLSYRGPRPERLTLVVSDDERPEGDLPQLVGVCSGRPIARW